MDKTAVVCGGGGFIGSHLVRRLKNEGYWVRAVDLKRPEFNEDMSDEFIVGDLRNKTIAEKAVQGVGDVVWVLFLGSMMPKSCITQQ